MSELIVSSENRLKIDPEFKNLIPPLTAEEYAGLEESILAEGCRDALILWDGILIDGHNRYEICTKHGIPFDTAEMDFPDRDAVMLWMIDQQRGRRNLSKADSIILAQKKADILRKEARAKQSAAGGDRKSDEYKTAFTNIGKSDSINVQEEIAKSAGVSKGTLSQFEQVQKKKPELIENIRKGEMSINQAYTEVKRQEKAEQRAEKMAALKEKAAVFDGNIVNGDCIAEMEKLADNSIDCVVTDPPYGIDYVSNFRTVESEVVKPVANDGLKDALTLWENACKVLSRKMKDNSHIYIFTSWKVYPQFEEITSRYFKVKNCLIWEKNNWSMGDLDGNYAEQYEMVIFATKGNRKLNGGRDTNILHFDRVANSALVHSCEKPVDLLSFLIEKSTDEGDFVADPFAGSGSTLVACKQTKRSYWGCELDRENYLVACGRVSDGD
jgi:site-specific DNA-methyltransferase (adenine-specific)